MKPDKLEYVQPNRNLLTMLFGNAHRINSLPMKKRWWLSESLIALERHDGNWDVFQTNEKIIFGGYADDTPYRYTQASHEKIKDNISAQEARDLIKSHDEIVLALSEKNRQELTP